MEITLTNEELEKIIKEYYLESRKLTVTVKVEDFKCGANYMDEENTAFSKKATAKQAINLFGLSKEVTEQLTFFDIENILKEQLSELYEADSFTCTQGFIKIKFHEKGQKRVRSL